MKGSHFSTIGFPGSDNSFNKPENNVIYLLGNF